MTNKPDLSKVWAENADPTDIKNPDLDEAGKFQKGWLSEIPPHTWFNYIQNNFSAALAHFNEYGVAQWDSATVYPVGGWARSTVDNEVYVALVAQSGNEPSVSPIQWNKVIVPVDLSPYAPLNSPTFTGTPTAPTPTAGDDSTKVATTAFVKTALPELAVGVNQTWQDVTSSRSVGVTYTNTSGKPIFISFFIGGNSGSLVVDGVTLKSAANNESNFRSEFSAIIPNGSTYLLSGGNLPFHWTELR